MTNKLIVGRVKPFAIFRNILVKDDVEEQKQSLLREVKSEVEQGVFWAIKDILSGKVLSKSGNAPDNIEISK